MTRILLENGGFLLLEDGFAMLTEAEDAVPVLALSAPTFEAFDFTTTPPAPEWELTP